MRSPAVFFLLKYTYTSSSYVKKTVFGVSLLQLKGQLCKAYHFAAYAHPTSTRLSAKLEILVHGQTALLLRVEVSKVHNCPWGSGQKYNYQERERKKQGKRSAYRQKSPQKDLLGRRGRMTTGTVIIMVWYFTQSFTTFAEGYSLLTRKVC